MTSISHPVPSLRRRGSGPLGRTPVVVALCGAAPLVALVHLAVAPSAWLAAGYGAVWGTGVLAAVPVATRWEVFDVAAFRAPGVFAVSFYGLVLLGAPTVFDAQRGDLASSRFLAASCLGYLITLGVASLVEPGVARDATPRRARTPLLLPGILAMLGIVVVVLGLYYAVAPSVPLLDALGGARQSELRQGRQDALSTLPNEQVAFLFGFVRVVLLPFLTATLLVWWLRSRRLVVAVAGLSVGAVAAVTSMLTLEKSPLLRLLVILAITVAVERRLRVRTIHVLVVVVVAMSFPFVVTVLNNSATTSNADIASGLARRAFVVPSEVSELYFEWAPEETDGFLGGRTIPHFSKLTAEGPVNAAGEVYVSTYGDARLSGGNANASYVSFLWVDFGWVGVLLGSAGVGLAIGLLQHGVDRLRATVFGPALQAVLSSQTIFLAMTSVFATVLQVPYGVLAVLGAVILLWGAGWSASPFVGRGRHRPVTTKASTAAM